MRQSRGFTLVELMMVIVIIGVLAAVAIPKFSDALIKAKTSEIPTILTTIANGEFMYYDELTTYVDIPEATWQTSLNSILGIEINSDQFIYFVTAASNTNYIAHAKLPTSYRTLPAGSEVLINASGTISFSNDPNNYLRRSVRAWAQ